MKNPRVSVIMPVFNVENYVAEAVESVLAQSFGDFELIIVDDGGTDRSMEIVAGYGDPRIVTISQPNRGLAGARNTGIAMARGEYIALIDSDDRWRPEKLMLHVIHLDNNPDVGVSFSGSRFIDARGRKMRQAQRPRLHKISAAHILCRNPVGNGSAPVIRRSTLDDVRFVHATDRDRLCWFDESFRQSEDIELWVRIALRSSFRFDGIANLLTEYRVVAGGLSANVIRQLESWERMMGKTAAYAPEFIGRHGPAARAYQLRYLARRSVQMGDGAFALMMIREAWGSSWRPIWEEPRKSLETIVAAWIARHVHPERLAALAAWWTRRGAAA